LIFFDYRWDEPWDGPNNRKLLSRMPAVYSDPIYGENKDFYTHYVAVVGEGMAFSPEGAKPRSDNLRGSEPGRGASEFADGLADTLVVGEVGPDRKIPWMKPEDLELDASGSVPALGKPGSFAMPYQAGRGFAAPFLRGDTSTVAILEGINDSAWRSLFTIAGKERIDWPTVPHIKGLRRWQRTHPLDTLHVITVITTPEAVRATTSYEPLKKR
jgi:hypothetical protein